MNFLAVALGGAIGAAGRYAISLMPVKAEFPVLTLTLARGWGRAVTVTL